MNDLPRGWIWTTLGEVVRPSRETVDPLLSPDLPYIGLEHVEAHTMRILLTDRAANYRSSAKRFVAGSVLYGRLRPYLNKVVQPGFDGLCSGEFIVFGPRLDILSDFLRYLLNSSSFVSFASHLKEGDRPRVDFDQMAQYEIALPPLAEQRRIVAEIEKQFTRLDEAQGLVNTSFRKVKKFSSASLRKVFGAEFVMKPLRELASIKGGLTMDAGRTDLEQCAPIPYLRVANVQRGFLDLSEVKTIMATPEEVNELTLRPGDVLFTEGGDRDKLGRGWVWDEKIEPCIHQNHVFRARIHGPVLPRWVSYYANEIGQSYFHREGKQTTNLASINIRKLGSLPIPVPPMEIQEQLLGQIEAHVSQSRHLLTEVAQTRHRATRLRQAILAKACSGRLVPQDPDDEPASVLLYRIRTERTRNAETSRRRSLQSKLTLQS